MCESIVPEATNYRTEESCLHVFFFYYKISILLKIEVINFLGTLRGLLNMMTRSDREKYIISLNRNIPPGGSLDGKSRFKFPRRSADAMMLTQRDLQFPLNTQTHISSRARERRMSVFQAKCAMCIPCAGWFPSIYAISTEVCRELGGRVTCVTCMYCVCTYTRACK